MMTRRSQGSRTAFELAANTTTNLSADEFYGVLEDRFGLTVEMLDGASHGQATPATAVVESYADLMRQESDDFSVLLETEPGLNVVRYATGAATVELDEDYLDSEPSEDEPLPAVRALVASDGLETIPGMAVHDGATLFDSVRMVYVGGVHVPLHNRATGKEKIDVPEHYDPVKGRIVPMNSTYRPRRGPRKIVLISQLPGVLRAAMSNFLDGSYRDLTFSDGDGTEKPPMPLKPEPDFSVAHDQAVHALERLERAHGYHHVVRRGQ